MNSRAVSVLRTMASSISSHDVSESSNHGEPPAAWLPATTEQIEKVLLQPDLQGALLESVGVHGIRLGAINQSWASAARHGGGEGETERRPTTFELLEDHIEAPVAAILVALCLGALWLPLLGALGARAVAFAAGAAVAAEAAIAGMLVYRGTSWAIAAAPLLVAAGLAVYSAASSQAVRTAGRATEAAATSRGAAAMAQDVPR